MRACALGFIAAATLVSSQADACTVGRFWMQWGDNTETTMSVDKGSSCAVRVGSGGASRIDSARVSAPPSRGVVRIDGSNGSNYRPSANYSGKDEFSVTLCGSDRGRSGCSTLRVRVTVN